MARAIIVGGRSGMRIALVQQRASEDRETNRLRGLEAAERAAADGARAARRR